jgi:hypothetical protein
VRTPDEEVVEEIVAWFRRDTAGTRQDARAQIELMRKVAPHFRRFDVKAIRADAREARRAIRIIRELLGDRYVEAEHVHPELRRMAWPGKVWGPDPRFNGLQWFCADAAHRLLKQHGTRDPVGTKDGNMHAVTQLIVRAVTGKPPRKHPA